MAYIGNQPAESFTSFATQEFSTSATTSYTLNHAVTNENEIALFVNNVRQQPGSGKAYTATGTALTLSAATASTDTMYCVFLGRALQTVVPATNSITAAMVGNDLISGKDALASEPADTDELLISDAGTLKRVDFSYLKSANTPAFFAHADANQVISNNTYTKVQIDTEIVDTDSKFDTSNNRFTPTVAGYYIIGGYVRFDSASTATDVRIVIYKNGSGYAYVVSEKTAVHTVGINQVVYLDSDDYVELFCSHNRGSDQSINGADPFDGVAASFYGYKLIGV